MAFKVNNGPEQEQEVFHLHARVIMWSRDEST